MTTDRNGSAEAAVRAHLREVSALPAYTAADWERLATRIVAAAEPDLAGRAPRPAWSEQLGVAARIALPLALAAGLAALVLLNRVEASAASEAAPMSAFLSAMAGETSRETVVDLTLGSVGPGLLLVDGEASR